MIAGPAESHFTSRACAASITTDVSLFGSLESPGSSSLRPCSDL